MTTPATELDAILQKIASETLDITTLERRNSDALDFKEVFIPNLKRALEMAYAAGKNSRE